MSASNWVTDVRFYSTEKQGRGPAARGTFTVADAIYVNFVIWENQDGQMQLTLPRTENKNFDASRDASKDNRKYFDEVGLVSREVREQLTTYIFSKLEQERTNAGTTSSFDDVPF